jgi:hypothetical protein
LERGGRLLVVERAAGRFTERDLVGKVVWRYGRAGELAITCRRLPGGETLVVTLPEDGPCQVRQVTRAGKETFSGEVGLFAGADGPLGSAQVLPNGHLLDASGYVPWWEVRQVEATSGQPAKTIRVKCDHEAVSFTPLPDGHLLVGCKGEVVEVDAAGKQVWKWEAGPNRDLYVQTTDAHGKTIWGLEKRRNTWHHATRLRNGNVLILSQTPDGMLMTEVDRSGQTMWETGLKGAAGGLRPCLGIVRLGLSHPRPAGWSVNSVAGRMWQLRTKNWRMRLRAVDQLGELGPKAAPAIPALIQALMDPEIDVSRQVCPSLVRFCHLTWTCV